MKKPTITQLCYSDTALSCGIDNAVPDKNIKTNLQALIDHILFPVKQHFGGQLDITSGYRCAPLNEKLGGAQNSQHCTGQAVDFGIIDTDIYDIAVFIRDRLDFDQLIMENRTSTDKNKGWVHVSYSCDTPNRKQVLTINGTTRHDGLVKEENT